MEQIEDVDMLLSQNKLEQLLRISVESRASDLHLSSRRPPYIRVDGDMKVIEGYEHESLDPEDVLAMAHSIMHEERRQDFKETLEADFSYEIRDFSRFRVNVFMQRRGPSIVLRTIPSRVLSLDDIQAPEVLAHIAEYQKGLVLVTGPTGSGKSTTLAAMLNHINHKFPYHILTIEDPIEFVHQSHKSLINQREVYRDTLSFGASLRAALREDPDVILVGEMRDIETIRLALTAAETGHLVFATLHTTSAPKTIDRIIDVFPGDEKAMVRSMLSESLRAVVSQTLVKRAGDEGGRVAAHEIMIATPAIKNLVREDKVAQMYSAIQMGAQLGMRTMEQSLNELYDRGDINEEQLHIKLERRND